MATIDLAFGGEHLTFACFDCADKMVRLIAVENVRAGALVVESANGYQRWRAEVGRPCTAAEAMTVAGNLS